VLIAPSGEQITIAAGDQQAVIVEVGGGLRSYSAGGRELVDGYSADEMSSSGRGQVLIPWPNRLQDGSYEFDKRHHQLPLNEPERRNAIHGLVRWAAWTTAEREPHRVVMEHLLHPQPGYPFSLRIRIEYALLDTELRVRTTATNLGTGPCPFGSGAHAYLTLGTATIDRLILHVPGRTVLRSDERGLPTGMEAVEDTEYDLSGNRGRSA
jgi:aldose 1-epimerase